MASGGNFILGSNNDASATTTLVASPGPAPDTMLFVQSDGRQGVFVRQTTPSEGPGGSWHSGVYSLAHVDSWGVVGVHASGQGEREGRGSDHAGVYGRSPYGTGVRGTSSGPFGFGVGVYGISENWHGVIGLGLTSAGVYGYATNADGVVGQTGGGRGHYGVVSIGDFLCYGAKHAAVPHADGQHRLLYCMESPECWFEDFGTARLKRGAASVAFPRDFAEVVRTNKPYHVFVTPEGDCNGLRVAKKTGRGFEVRELGKGTSSVVFSFRIVAQRKDVEAPRLPKVKLDLPEKLRAPKMSKPPQRAGRQ